jgi:hypothetical protein
MASTTTTTTLSMKLLIDTKKNRVLFAEADKDVVDFLFSLLALPIATIVGKLGKESMCGSFGNLYASVENLDYKLVLPGAEKKTLLQPTVVPSAATTSTSSLLLPLPAPRPEPPKSFFKCSESGDYYNARCREYVTDSSRASCPNCGKKMTRALKYVPPPPAAADGTGGGQSAQMGSSTGGAIAIAKGFVQGVVTYTVRDNLVVNSMSTISSISLLNTLAVTDFAALQEKTVQLSYTEVIDESIIS